MNRPSRTTRTRRTAVAAALALLPMLGACGSDDDGPSAAELRQTVLSALATDVMVAAYEQVDSTTGELSAAITAASAAPADEAARASAQDRWSAARGAWLRTRAFRFGPATILRTMSTIDFPIDSSKVDALLAGDDPLDAPALAGRGSDQRGLEGVEHVLFADGALEPRACEYLVGAAQLVATAADGVLAGWTQGIDGGPAFVAQLTGPGVDGGMYATEHEGYEDLVNSMIFALADVADARIGRASGDVTGEPLPAEVDAGRARRARQDAIDVVAGVQRLYEGATAGRGLRDVVATVSDATAETMSTQLEAALGALDAIPQPLAAATDPAPAHAAYDALKAAQVTLRAEIASQLGITLTFGDADGDS